MAEASGTVTEGNSGLISDIGKGFSQVSSKRVHGVRDKSAWQVSKRYMGLCGASWVSIMAKDAVTSVLMN